MIGNGGQLRPWGMFHDVMPSQAGEAWALLACASVEARCLAVFRSFQAFGIDGPQLVLEIDDPLSAATPDIEALTANSRSRIQQLGFQSQTFAKIKLNGSFGEFESVLRRFLNQIGQTNLVVDITSLPKKVYFFLLKLLFQDPLGPRNVVFTYAEPERYSNDPLAANPDPWEALPGFRVSPRVEASRRVVVGIGYEPLGLPGLVDSGEFDESQITFLFPFPAQVDRVARNWRFIRGIFPNSDTSSLSIIRVDGINVPEVFQTLSKLGDGGETALTLAPFGPKPVSLAMALYAAKYSQPQNQTGVYYTQPTYYNPYYSVGIRKIGGHFALNTYCVKLRGQILY